MCSARAAASARSTSDSWASTTPAISCHRRRRAGAFRNDSGIVGISSSRSAIRRIRLSRTAFEDYLVAGRCRQDFDDLDDFAVIAEAGAYSDPYAIPVTRFASVAVFGLSAAGSCRR